MAGALEGADPLLWVDAHYESPDTRFTWNFSPGDNDALAGVLSNLLRKGADSPEIDRLDDMAATGGIVGEAFRIFLVLYAPGHKRILITRGSDKGTVKLSDVFRRLIAHKRTAELCQGSFSLQIDVQEVPSQATNFYKIGMLQRGSRHFEVGIDGLSFRASDNSFRYFIPGDAYVRSIMGMRQLREYFHRAYGEAEVREGKFERFRTRSYLVYGDTLVELYRGIPRVGELAKEHLEHAVYLAKEHIKYTQRADGSFLYYYEPVTDSRQDFEHPSRNLDVNPYYNILRHSGGGLACIYHEKYNQTGDTLANLRAALVYLKEHAIFYEVNGRRAAYIYSEKKSKLGGAGIGLYLLAEYQLLSGDDTFNEFADAIAWHTIHQVTDTGEFIYYNIYLDKEISVAENKNYFSFYYPGEAICGLAKYLHLITASERPYFFEKMHSALDFLINVRPIERASEYTKVPSDSWLMMGIMELWDFPEMRKPLYSNFVFEDARVMIEQMYKVTDAPYPDYAGAFYYEYGDYPYADGARLEGLMGAYELAIKMGDQEVRKRLWKALRLGAWALAHLVNHERAIYCAKKPNIALGGIRFKYTRQWFRIDTIQHVSCFYAKMLPYWDSEEATA